MYVRFPSRMSLGAECRLVESSGPRVGLGPCTLPFPGVGPCEAMEKCYPNPEQPAMAWCCPQGASPSPVSPGPWGSPAWTEKGEVTDEQLSLYADREACGNVQVWRFKPDVNSAVLEALEDSVVYDTDTYEEGEIAQIEKMTDEDRAEIQRGSELGKRLDSARASRWAETKWKQGQRVMATPRVVGMPAPAPETMIGAVRPDDCETQLGASKLLGGAIVTPAEKTTWKTYATAGVIVAGVVAATFLLSR